jgi:hypothetical protein
MARLNLRQIPRESSSSLSSEEDGEGGGLIPGRVLHGWPEKRFVRTGYGFLKLARIILMYACLSFLANFSLAVMPCLLGMMSPSQNVHKIPPPVCYSDQDVIAAFNQLSQL